MKRVLLGVMCLAWMGAAQAQTAPVPPAAPPVVREPSEAPARAGTAQAQASRTEMQELIEAARATAKATREGVDYNRVVPDLLTQILAKLDKIESGRSAGRKR